MIINFNANQSFLAEVDRKIFDYNSSEKIQQISIFQENSMGNYHQFIPRSYLHKYRHLDIVIRAIERMSLYHNTPTTSGVLILINNIGTNIDTSIVNSIFAY